MDNFNEINSYNSLTMSPNIQKESRSSTSYSLSKMKTGNEINEAMIKNEINSYKRVSIDLHSNNPQKSILNAEKLLTNIQNISTKDEDSSSSTFTKLPKIQKHLTSSSTLSGFKKIDSTNYFSKENNSSNSNILNQKDLSLINNNSIANSNLASRVFNSSKNTNKKRSHYMGSAHSIHSNHIYNQYNQLFSPPDPLLKRTVVPKVNPRFGKMKAHITLPEFRGEEPIIKFEYKPTLKEKLISPSIEKQYEVNLYVNSSKMLNNLIYLKTGLNKDGLISLENLVNVKKLNKNYKNETEEEDDMMQIEAQSNNFSNNILDDSKNDMCNNYLEKNNTQENNKIEINKQSDMDISRNAILQNSHLSSKVHQLKKKVTLLHNKLQRPKTVYHELKPYYTLKNKNDNTLIFESRFESGNLLCAFRTEDENSYQLYLQNDTNTTGYIQWFFFRVSNTKKGRKVNFNIINMLRNKCLYSHGLKVMTYSTMAAIKENLGWHRDSYNSMYYANNLYVYNNNNDNKRRNLHSLTFDYEFKYDNDTVYFANCLPYFYSTLMKELNKYELNEEKYPYFHRKTLAMTLGRNDLDMFTINSMYDIYQNGITSVITPKSQNYLYFKNNQENINNKSQILDERKAIVIIGRQHPGETVSSYVIKGMMDFLMGDSDEAKKLRDIYVFKIVPMMNPDGVLVGNSRTSFAGCDLNRRWGKPNEIIHPEIYNTKQMILKLSSQRNIGFIIDCHGHFGTFNALFYCNFKENKRTCRLFPYICSKLSKIISFQQSSFAMPKFKLSTERVALFNELYDEDNNNIVALETSFFGTNRIGDYSHTYYNSTILKEIGRDVCMGMLSYYYKYENVTIETNLFSNKENVKKLDVDMREFESEIIREVNEDDEEADLNDEKSESEPSVDNLDKNQLMRLMPINGKRRKRRKNKYKKFDKKKDNKIKDMDIELFNPLKEAAKKLEEEKRKKSKSKIVINCNNTDKLKKMLRKQVIMTDTNMKNAYTQTEEIFFKKHWSFFSGQYKILSCNRFNFLNNNYMGISSGIFGQLNNKYFKRQMNLNNLSSINKFNGNSNNNMNNINNNNINNRSKSLNNKIMINNKKDIPLVNKSKKNINNNRNININSSKNSLNKNNNKINIEKEQKNGGENEKNKIIEKERHFNFNLNSKEIKKELSNKEFIKPNFSIPFPIKGNHNKSSNKSKENKNNIIINKKEKDNGIINNINNSKVSSNNNNIKVNESKEMIKIKMTKSSSSFYN